ncbi:MAG: hypothetical protein J1F64_07055 [Oscillospiraceae bacterium]|nr:hypothetical protein [Oscillospiraceae bacterium]
MSAVEELARHIRDRDNPSPYTPMFGKIISLPICQCTTISKQVYNLSGSTVQLERNRCTTSTVDVFN